MPFSLGGRLWSVLSSWSQQGSKLVLLHRVEQKVVVAFVAWFHYTLQSTARNRDIVPKITNQVVFLIYAIKT